MHIERLVHVTICVFPVEMANTTLQFSWYIMLSAIQESVTARFMDIDLYLDVISVWS